MDKISYALGLGIAHQIKNMNIENFSIEDFAQSVRDVIEGNPTAISSREAQQMLNDYFQKKEKAQAETAIAEGSVFLKENAKKAGVPVISSMGAGNKINPTAFEIADIYETSIYPLARVMRRECKKRGIDSLKVVYSKEKPIRPLEDMSISCRQHCICPPGTARKCTERRDIPGSTAFVPSVVGLIIAGEIINDLSEIQSHLEEYDVR